MCDRNWLSKSDVISVLALVIFTGICDFNRWLLAEYSMIEYIRVRIKHSTVGSIMIWCCTNKSYWLNKVVVWICYVWYRQPLATAVSGWKWKCAKLKNCSSHMSENTAECDRWNLWYSLPFFSKNSGSSEHRKYICLNSLFIQYHYFGYSTLASYKKKKKYRTPSTSSFLGILLPSALRRKTGVKRPVTVIQRSNWK